MKGFELVKREDHWALYNEDGHKIAATIDGCNSKLSIKNCETIENGYDLDELADEYYKRLELVPHKGNAYISGFQKALEILGDNKFSELDMRIAYDAGCNNIDADDNIDFQDTINSLQQTEWDVEIDVLMTEREGGVVIETPKLDADGCLILKRI
jgi:hypothetical protein